MTIVAFLLAFIGYFLFLKGNHVSFLTILVVLTFDFFGAFGVNDYSSDAMVFMIILILGTQWITGKHPLSVKGDAVGRIILFLLLWIIIRYVFSIFLNEETPIYGLKVIRHDLFLLSYFVLRQIRISSFSSLFKILIPITVVLGLYGLVVSFIDGFDGNVFERKTVLTLTIPLLFSLLTKDLKVRFRLLLITLFVVFIVMTLARGIFLATCIAIAAYYLIINKVSVRNYLLIIPLAVVFFFLYSNMESSKSEGGSESAVHELAEAREMGSFENFQGGSFLLRFAMAWERGDYLVNHPQALLFGVGTIHEDSPNNRFTFGIGSFKTIDDVRSKQMIDTDDVAFLAHWMRYGSVYFILFCIFLFSCYKKVWTLRQNKYMVPLLMLLISMSISVVSVDSFSRANRFIIALMMLSMTYQYSQIPKKKH